MYLVAVYWSDGRSESFTLDHFPTLGDIPVGVVRVDIAIPHM